MSEENETIILDFKLQYGHGENGYKWKLTTKDPRLIQREGTPDIIIEKDHLSQIQDVINQIILMKLENKS